MIRNLFVGAILGAALLWAPGDAAASVCLAQVSSEAPTDPGTVVFVGTAVDTEARALNALVHVEEIWYGGPLGEWQAVITVQASNIYVTGVSQFTTGERYVVVATREGSRLRNDCSTSPYTASLAERRPDRVSAPTAASRPLVWGVGVLHPLSWWHAGLIGLIIIGAVGLYRLRDDDTPTISPLIR